MKKNLRDQLFRWPRLAIKCCVRASFAILLFCLFSEQSFAGAFALTVSGKVVDEKGAALAGASILEKGTSNTVATKNDGSFAINLIKDKATLVISYVGYAQQEVAVKGAGPLLIKLSLVSQAVDSVVVVGYGRQKKESVVGAIVQTTGATLQRAGGVSSIGAALTGNG